MLIICYVARIETNLAFICLKKCGGVQQKKKKKKKTHRHRQQCGDCWTVGVKERWRRV